jgi:glucan phosphoethanolaminetransferase (alkaline phosphatase superfamily)
MAVSKIRKISSWTLLAVIIISAGVLALFYFGGVVDPNAEQKEPIHTAELLYWCYAILGLAVAGLLIFGVIQFITSLLSKPKSALISLVVIVAFAALFIITYSIGDGTELANINADSAKYNVEGWLKISDMWLYTTYTLLVLSILAMIFGSVKKVFNK